MPNENTHYSREEMRWHIPDPLGSEIIDKPTIPKSRDTCFGRSGEKQRLRASWLADVWIMRTGLASWHFFSG